MKKTKTQTFKNNLSTRSSFFYFDFKDTSYLNLLRILAIFSVLLLHIHMFGETQVYLLEHCYFLNFVKNALAPVGFFFLLSGFLFNKVYLNRIVKKEITGKQFWCSKFIKFFPFALLTTVLFYVLSLISTYGLNIPLTRGSTRIIDLLLGVFLCGGEIFTGNYTVLNAALWYINILIFVYIVAYLLSLLYKKVPHKIIFVIPLLAGLAMGFLKNGYPFCNILFGRGLTNFFLGFYVYELGNKLSRLKAKGTIITRSICLFLICFYVFSYFYFYKYKASSTIYDFVDFGLVNIFFWIPLMFLLNGKIPNKLAKLKPINFACSLTFDIYIWHQPTFAIIEIIMLTSKIKVTKGVGYFFIIIGSVILVSILSYLFLDKRLKKKAEEFVRI